jgi:hypothetical protein
MIIAKALDHLRHGSIKIYVGQASHNLLVVFLVDGGPIQAIEVPVQVNIMHQLPKVIEDPEL